MEDLVVPCSREPHNVVFWKIGAEDGSEMAGSSLRGEVRSLFGQPLISWVGVGRGLGPGAIILGLRNLC